MYLIVNLRSRIHLRIDGDFRVKYGQKGSESYVGCNRRKRVE